MAYIELSPIPLGGLSKYFWVFEVCHYGIDHSGNGC